MGPAMLTAIMVMPAYGVTLFVLNLVPTHWAAAIVRQAAWVYGIFVAGGALVASQVTSARIGLSVPLAPAALLALLLAGPCAYVVYFTELFASTKLRPSVLPDFGPDIESASGAVAEVAGHAKSFIALAVLTAVAEEVLFRGIVLPETAEDHGYAVALLATAAVFAFHHAVFGVPAVIGKSVAGLLWGGLSIGAGTIAPALLSHLTFQGLVYRRMRRTA